jgi:hypothetical protein
VNFKIIAPLVIMAALLNLASASNPLEDASDSLKSQVVEKANITGTGIEQRAVKSILEGNYSSEKMRDDVNATKKEIKQRAVQKINSEIDNASEGLKQKVASDLKSQVNATAQQPGFESACALLALAALCAFLQKRRL